MSSYNTVKTVRIGDAFVKLDEEVISKEEIFHSISINPVDGNETIRIECFDKLTAKKLFAVLSETDQIYHSVKT